MEKKYPLVSILLPVYNCERFLNECLESIFAQSYQNFEIIAIDDCSTDNSFLLLSQYNNSKIKLLRNDFNRGNSYTLNMAINMATGVFLMRMDADDYIDKNRLEKQVDYLMNNPLVDVVGCNYIRVTYSGLFVHEIRNPTNHNDIVSLLSLKNFFLFGPNFGITDGTIMAKADWFKRTKYDPNIFYSQDFDMLSRSLEYSVFANLNESLYFYRQGSGVTANIRAQLIACFVKFRAIKKMKNITFQKRLLCYISLLLRPWVYLLIYFYYKLIKR